MNNLHHYIYITLIIFISSIWNTLVYAQSGNVAQEEWVDIFGTLWQIPEDDTPVPTNTDSEEEANTTVEIEKETWEEEEVVIIETISITPTPEKEEPKENQEPQKPSFISLDDIEPLILSWSSDDTSTTSDDDISEEEFDALLDTWPTDTTEKENEALTLPIYVAPEPVVVPPKDTQENIEEEVDTEEIDIEELIEDEELDEETIRTFSQPELNYIPQTPKANAFGYLYPETVKSIVDDGEDQIRCSLLAKENIRRFTHLWTQPGLRRVQDTISTWNAVDLIIQWSNSLRKVTPVELLSLENTILTLVESKNQWTIVDLYMRRPNQEWVLKWHRAMAFVWADLKVYILDPIVYYKSSAAHQIWSYPAKVWAWVERFIDPTPYRVHPKYIDKNSEPEIEVRQEEALANICDSSMYQEILLEDDYISIQDTTPFQTLFQEGSLKVIETTTGTEFLIGKDTIINLPWYPTISITASTKITSSSLWFRETLWLDITRDPEKRTLIRWSELWTIEFDKPIEIIFDDIQSMSHMTHRPVSEIYSKSSIPALVSHPSIWCHDEDKKYIYIPTETREDGISTLYMCSSGRIDIVDQDTQ